MTKRLILPLLGLLYLSACGPTSDTDNSEELKFYRPASAWVEATPLGNGRLAAMDFGQINRQLLQLNEESLWAGCPQIDYPPDAGNHMKEFRRLLLGKQYEEAYNYGMEHLTFRPTSFRSFQPLAVLHLDFELVDSAENYERILDMSDGIERTDFTIDGITYTKELFISAVDNALVYKISSSELKALNVQISLDREKDADLYMPDDSTILLSGQIIDIEAPDDFDDNPGESGEGGAHMKFAARLKVVPKDGSIQANLSGIKVEAASEIILYLTAATDFEVKDLNFDRSIDPLKLSREAMDKILLKKYKDVRKDHIAEHKGFFDRVDLDLGPTTMEGADTYERITRVIAGETDPILDAQYYQFGRYLLMSSSRAPGVLPANLQGIWNDKFWAPWEADYHLNINLQMNYWPALAGNLAETFIPLISYFKPLSEKGYLTADTLYGSSGWIAHTAASLFGRTSPSGSTEASQLINGYAHPLAGAWMSLSLYRYFEYTLDTLFLRESAFAILQGAAQFVMDYLVEGENGELLTVPSSSPENNFIDPATGNSQRLTVGATMENQIIRELLSSTIAAGELLHADPGFIQSMKETKNRIPTTKIGANGTIMEWIEDYEEVEPGHRHMSHMFALHPSYQITPDETPELAKAAEATLERRLANGGGHTGWSRAWLVNFYARLWQGEEAYKHFQLLLQKSTKLNLFDNHPPFQIDGNLGGTAGVSEMLLQSRPGKLILLPALPQAWGTGHIFGLKARGNITVDMEWEDMVLTKLVLYSPVSQTLELIYGDSHIIIIIKQNSSVKLHQKNFNLAGSTS